MPKDWGLTRDHPWQETRTVEPTDYLCGFCGNNVASATGLTAANVAYIRICPQCNGPTFFSSVDRQYPGARQGGFINKLPSDVASLYDEARDSMTVNVYTGSVMLCRKILMNVAVEKSAKEGLQFAAYVAWLVAEGYAPKGSEGWVTYIKNRGNDANHEIVPMDRADARGVLRFTEQLLRNIFELPNLIPPDPAAQSGTGSNVP